MPPPHADDELLLRPTPSPATPASSWGPFSGADDFGSTMAIILAALFSTVLLAFSLTAAARLLLARCRPSEDRVDPDKSAAAAAAVQVPTTLFSAAGTRLAGAVAECAICLTEFAEGDAVQVLPACNHGFHRRCVEQWLATRGSCPTCRAACGVAQTHGPPDEAQSVDV